MDFKETACHPVSTVGQAARAGDLSQLKRLVREGNLPARGLKQSKTQAGSQWDLLKCSMVVWHLKRQGRTCAWKPWRQVCWVPLPTGCESLKRRCLAWQPDQLPDSITPTGSDCRELEGILLTLVLQTLPNGDAGGGIEQVHCFTGCAVDLMDNRGWRPTHEAAHGNHLECLQYLLRQGSPKIANAPNTKQKW